MILTPGPTGFQSAAFQSEQRFQFQSQNFISPAREESQFQFDSENSDSDSQNLDSDSDDCDSEGGRADFDSGLILRT